MCVCERERECLCVCVCVCVCVCERERERERESKYFFRDIKTEKLVETFKSRLKKKIPKLSTFNKLFRLVTNAKIFSLVNNASGIICSTSTKVKKKQLPSVFRFREILNF